MTSTSICLLIPLAACNLALCAEVNDASSALAAFVDKMPAGRRGSQASDLSAVSYEKTLQETKARLAELRKIDSSKLSVDERIDGRFAESILTGRLIEQERIQG